MKYKNAMTKELLKEFRQFNKWASKNIYSFKCENQEEEFNKNITSIVKIYTSLKKEVKQ